MPGKMKARKIMFSTTTILCLLVLSTPHHNLSSPEKEGTAHGDGEKIINVDSRLPPQER